MTGDDKKRLCSLCNLNVYNVSAMPPSEAEAFLSSQLGKKVCVKYFKRHDGTLINQSCPVGLRQLRRQGQKVLQLISSFLTFLVSGFISVAHSEPISEANHTATANDSSQEKQSEHEPIPPVRDEGESMGMLDWDTVKTLSTQQSKEQKQLTAQALQLKSQDPHTTSEKIVFSKLHIDLAKKFCALTEFKQAEAEYKEAATLLKNIKAEKQLYRSAVLNAQACCEHKNSKTTDRHQSKNH